MLEQHILGIIHYTCIHHAFPRALFCEWLQHVMMTNTNQSVTDGRLFYLPVK